MEKKTNVLVTGATSGIGLATALLLSQEGCFVFAAGRSEEKLGRVQEEANQAHVKVHPVILDVTDTQSIEEMKANLLDLTEGYGVDVLVNNAGYAEAGAIEEIPLSSLRRQFETNVFGLVSVSQVWIPLMRRRHSGKIINISSVLGKFTLPLMGAYSASKHAVEALSDAMRIELADAGIFVSMVAPGSVETNFGGTVAHTMENWMDEKSPHYRRYLKFQQDRQNDGGAKPDVIAKVILSIVRSNRPKARYAATYDSKLLPVATGLLPKKAIDKILRKYIMGG